MPAARAACTPTSASSMTTQLDGGKPISRAASRKRSGAGLPSVTSSAPHQRLPNRSNSPADLQGKLDPVPTSGRGYAIRCAGSVQAVQHHLDPRDGLSVLGDKAEDVGPHHLFKRPRAAGRRAIVLGGQRVRPNVLPRNGLPRTPLASSGTRGP